MGSTNCLVVGCGYLGRRVAQAWREEGFSVWATTRSNARAGELAADGIEPVILDVAEPVAPGRLPKVDRVLFAVGFDRSGPYTQDQVYVAGIRHLLAGLVVSPRQFIYVSSTGVYGQTDGEWVDETSPTEPTRPGGKCCLAAEASVLSHPRARHGVILRLAGIYGPERVPYLNKLRAGEPLPVATEGFLNLIHVDDAVRVVQACPIEIESPQVFTVSDGHPVRRKDYYDEIGRLLGLQVSYAPVNPDSPRAARSLGSKRVSNARMLEQLRVQLEYPSYQQGLKQILVVSDGD